MFKYAIIVSSDKGAQGLREDGCIPVIQKCMDTSFELVYSTIVMDEIDELQKATIHATDVLGVDLLLISGGTGFSIRDVTPEAINPLIEKFTPGISEAIRAYSMTITKKAMLSRAISGIRKQSLIITLPGSPRAVEESLIYILEPLKHGLEIMIGSAKECARKD
ncbi:MAG: molybdenum cofactor biosynthesis protein [Firmicutes bacterium HGW-Firmicutes-20]|jgi:molybdenum cofactor synthesis domain-containing protein|nr:MAG: molybdenum cofactor biosynthesis protein [Firmicutes bacterium HGW-Firmicutes-20]PKM88372.1 MAG: molybdenum cofactor biosynthesis protein [Firmicutes bacterium HGW-Firmicutes-10]